MIIYGTNLTTEIIFTGIRSKLPNYSQIRVDVILLGIPIGSRLCHVNITFTSLDIIHRPVFYLKPDNPEAGF
jgi:hypothetical protein